MFTNTTQEPKVLKVTFWYYSKLLKREFVNVEYHKSMDDVRLRALALNWTVSKVEAA